MYKEIVRPVLDRLDSETWHIRAGEALHLAETTPFTLRILEQFANHGKRYTNEKLNVVLGGKVVLDNPLMVGAGWDKIGHSVHGLWQLGFSGVEVGSVLAYPQPGNPKPRQFVLEPGVVLNRIGFDSPGMDIVANNLKRYKGSGIPIGINIGKNKDIEFADTPRVYAEVTEILYDDASYFVINVSSPNTVGLCKFQEKAPLTDIVQTVNQTMDKKGGRKPLFIKISPDLDLREVDDVIDVVIANGVTGIVASNTSANEDLKAKYGQRWQNQPGGLSGDDQDFRRMSTEQITHIYRGTNGRVEIIGVGGVKDTATALEKIKAGAKVVQVVSAIRSEGTTLPGKINRGIVEYMDREGINNIDQLVGSQLNK